MGDLLIIPPIILGLVIGLYELILIHKDENFRGSHWFGHGLHAAGWAIVAVFIVMNTGFIYSKLAFLQSIPFIQKEIVLQLTIGLLTIVKIHGSSAVMKISGVGGKGMKETWMHSLIVGVLIVATPYVWPFIEPFMGGVLGRFK